MPRVAYRIRVAGVVPARFFEDFSRVTIAVDQFGTTLRADLADQAELHGLLDALRRGGLQLMDVRREQPPESEPALEDEDSTRSWPDSGSAK